MKKNLILIISFFLLQNAMAQPFNVDSLRKKIEHSAEDTNKVRMLGILSSYYNHNHLDSGFYFARQMIALSRKFKYPYGEALGLSILATSADRTGDMTKSLEITLSCLRLAETLTDGRDEMMTRAYTQMGVVNLLTGHEGEARSFLYEALNHAKNSYPDDTYYYQIYSHLSNSFRRQGLLDTSMIRREVFLDSSFFYAQKGYALSLHSDQVYFYPYARNCEGDINVAIGRDETAKDFYHAGIAEAIKINHLFQLTGAYNQMSGIFNRSGMPDSAVYYAKKSIELSQQFYYSGEFVTGASNQLSRAFEKLHQPDSALKYLKLSMEIKEKVMNQSKQQQLQLLDFEEQQRGEKLELANQEYKTKVRTSVLAVSLFVLAIIIFLLYRNNRIEQRSNISLQEQKQKVEHALSELKLTQTQLIQSEKMASLGELTAGIAHEIQNPLNFVNNFSEVSNELVDEMNDELNKGEIEQAKAIAKDIKQNLEKINHHGKRADAIVKGMLQHSRSSTGAKEPTDINALADEYLRLAYHGLRAKDKNFNATMKTDFDESIGKINIIPQDIGRVLLNLYNNAFYEINEKFKAQRATPNAVYEPTISLTTKRSDKLVTLVVSDNGNGIPQKIVDKIFQPFFTTKPTGSGTGLGLSLSYDIIKAHGGEIKVKTNENEGTTFTIQLPINLS